MSGTANPSAAAAQNDVRRRQACRVCDSGSVELLFSLGATPPANALLSREELSKPEPYFPLDVYMCRGCAHVQLLDVVDPALLFTNYLYVSGTSPVFVEHFRRYADSVTSRIRLTAGDLVVDVGSNDGTLLRFFKDGGARVLGIDPAVEIARQATARGLETLPVFFDRELAQRLAAERGRARVITANNVFAHTDDLIGFLAAVKELLTADGAFVFEVSYLLDVYEKTLFDTIYHEHLSYHSVKPLAALCARAGMQLFDVERVDSHGGSIRGYARLAGGPHPVSDRVASLIADEAAVGLHDPAALRRLHDQVMDRKRELRELLATLRADGRRVAGFGAPAKATTLMHVFDLDAGTLDYIVDDNPMKQGRYSPGHHVPIVASAVLDERPPDYLLILAWNFADAIIGRQRAFAERGGRFIVPLPTVRVH